MTTISGTREWSVASVNCLTGCSHDCRYCYARANALRFRRIKSAAEWARPVVRQREVSRRRRKAHGRVMFPTTHDVLPEFLGPCIEVLRNLLGSGNEVLIVSKPHIECVQAICRESWFARTLDGGEITFRFTLGALDEALLSYWEPGAPSAAERLASLEWCHAHGWRTSISAEPLLDAAHVVELVDRVAPYVTDTIWIGAMNQIRARCVPGTDPEAIALVEAGQTPHQMRAIYDALKDRRSVRWKESFKRVLGLDLAQEAGLDL